MSGPRAPLRLTVLQTAPVLLDIDGNTRALARPVGDADLVLTPELSLTGYDVRDSVHDLALPIEIGGPVPAPLDLLAPTPTVVIGLIEQGADGIPYNTAVVLEGGRVRHRHRKIYLPTYGLFDEGRYFGRGDSMTLFEVAGWRVALLICEDLWHPGLVYAAALAGSDLLVVPAAAAGRGVFEGGPGDSFFASAIAWHELARVTARTHGIYVALANRVGVEDGLTFAGGSRIVAPDGAEVAVAPETEEHRLDVLLEPGEIARARRPFAHLRDEDVRLLAQLLPLGGRRT